MSEKIFVTDGEKTYISTLADDWAVPRGRVLLGLAESAIKANTDHRLTVLPFVESRRPITVGKMQMPGYFNVVHQRSYWEYLHPSRGWISTENLEPQNFFRWLVYYAFQHGLDPIFDPRSQSKKMVISLRVDLMLMDQIQQSALLQNATISQIVLDVLRKEFPK